MAERDDERKKETGIVPELGEGMGGEGPVEEGEVGERLGDRRRRRSMADGGSEEAVEGVAGQGHLLGTGRLLRRMIEEDRMMSLVFWGPPGSGKTTLARIIARHTAAEFVPFSAVTSGIKEIRQVMSDAAKIRSAIGR